MANDGTPLFRDGKLIARVTTRSDGALLMAKAQQVKDNQVMDITGAPGWDARYVDQFFPRYSSPTEDKYIGIDRGYLGFTRNDVEYTIDIETFRQHAFKKDSGFGEQYHCHIQHYRSSGQATSKSEPHPQRKERLTFGTDQLCPSCKGYKKDCKVCGGNGVVRRT